MKLEGACTVFCRYPVGGEMKYASEAQELIRPERNTLMVSFEDVERYNQQLATTILEEYYRYCCDYLNLKIFFEGRC